VKTIGLYRDALLRVAFRITGEIESSRDAVQDVFAQFLEKSEDFSGTSSLKTYLYRMVINRCIDMRRKRVRFGKILNAFSMLYPKGFDPAEARDTQDFVRFLLDRLPDVYRVPLVLAEIDGMSYEEIAVTIGITASAVRTRIFRGREKLRKEGEKHTWLI
jgi:RNA polymerase sigma-70 factor (ECF subfamily)